MLLADIPLLPMQLVPDAQAIFGVRRRTAFRTAVIVGGAASAEVAAANNRAAVAQQQAVTAQQQAAAAEQQAAAARQQAAAPAAAPAPAPAAAPTPPPPPAGATLPLGSVVSALPRDAPRKRSTASNTTTVAATITGRCSRATAWST